MDTEILKVIGKIEYSNFKALTLLKMYKECCDLSDDSFDPSIITEMILDQVQETEDLIKTHFMNQLPLQNSENH